MGGHGSERLTFSLDIAAMPPISNRISEGWLEEYIWLCTTIYMKRYGSVRRALMSLRGGHENNPDTRVAPV